MRWKNTEVWDTFVKFWDVLLVWLLEEWEGVL